MSAAIVPMFNFTEQCDWLHAFLDRPPSILSADSHEWALFHAVDELLLAGEVSTAVVVAWLSLIRSSDPNAGLMLDVQRAIRNVVLFGRPELLASCLESPSRAGEGVGDGAR